MRQVLLVQYRGIESSATGLVAHVAVDFLGAEVLYGECVVNRLHRRLDREWVRGLAKL